ncbi:hypothetical protein OPT61_g3494 [Boeremia exigua]|uniref:Uncharacterized protein n=1 Tax=Boeremia exigua TaxID=749465 RepID=A0ACC2IHR0_9PLEO|nr:hypothetical protein OPT61_g3494 [Boeremia exigua]
MKHVPAILGLVALVSASPISIRQNNSTTNSSADSFADVPVTKDLKWKTCMGGNFSCLNLEVPLDYEHPEIGNTNIAFLRYEASVQPALGDIIINPGGPGGSGVATLLKPRGWTSMLGDRYNLIGMDPRGVNNSGPNVDPLVETPATRNNYAFELNFEFDPKSPVAVKNTFVHAGAYGDYASQKLTDDVNYVNTPAVARDMLHYVELLAESQGEDKTSAKLNFFGVSYGSILGTTFAQLYPERVGRMVIDGVMEASDYYDGAWTKSVNQADDAVRAFTSQCFDAGSNCAFFANDTSPGAILQRLDTILRDIEQNPMSVAEPDLLATPTVLNHMDVRNLLLVSSYSSYANFPFLAQVLAELEQGNGTSLAVVSSKGTIQPAECDGTVPAYNIALSKFATACNDMDGRHNISSVEQFEDYIRELESVSTYLGAPWAKVMALYCRELQFSPPHVSEILLTAYKETQTSPILFVSNTIDPVTSSLEEMIKFFPGAGSFYQNAVGHGTLITKSNCTSEHMIRYVETGELPPPGLVCEPDTKVFPDAGAV